MLSFLPPPSSSPPYGPNTTIPHIPSPLSPRSVNISTTSYARPSPSWMEGKKPQTKHVVENAALDPEHFKRKAVFAKKAPTPSTDEVRERRRGMFLRKVREGREERAWKGRGEDIMRLDFMQRQRAWEAELARSAPKLEEEPSDEEVLGQVESAMDVAVPAGTQEQPLPEEELDEVLQLERAEMEALLAMMPEQELQEDEEEDYDALFDQIMGGISQDQRRQEMVPQSEQMDLS